MKYSIERATAQDKDAITKVLTPWNLHHALTLEPEAIDLSLFFVAKVSGNIIGVAGYTILSKEKARTRLLAVYPEFRGCGIGKALQDARLEEMYRSGIKSVESRSDRAETILWYKKYYGYCEVGKIKKEIPSGFTDVEYSTVLELDLELYMRSKEQMEKKREQYIASHDPHPLSPYPPLIINVALTGIIPTKTLTPYVPVATDEIVEDCIRVHDAGASIVHLHARDRDGKFTSSARYYEDIITAVRRERSDLICCVTTSGRNGQSFEERSEVLHLTGSAKPDMASLTTGSLNFLSGPSVNSLETIQRLAFLMKEKNIKPELEVFDIGMVNAAKYLERHNIISGTKYFNILLGNLNTASASIHELSHITSSLPENSVWAAGGLERFQLPMNTAAIVAGGHVRVGLEDNIHHDVNRTTLTTNEKLVKRIVRIANELERAIATPLFTRKALDIQKG